MSNHNYNNKIEFKIYSLLIKMMKMVQSNEIATMKIRCKFSSNNNKLIIN